MQARNRRSDGGGTMSGALAWHGGRLDEKRTQSQATAFLLRSTVLGFPENSLEDRFHLWSSQRWMDKAGGDLVTGAWSAVVVFLLGLHAARTSSEDAWDTWENALCIICPILLLGPYMLQAWLPYELYLRHRETLMVLMRVFFIVLAQAVEPTFFCAPGCGHRMRAMSGCVWGFLSSFGHRVRLAWHMCLQVLWVAARVGCGMKGNTDVDPATVAMCACCDLLGTSAVVMVLEVRRRAEFLRACEAAAKTQEGAADGEASPEVPSEMREDVRPTRPLCSLVEELEGKSLRGSPLHPSRVGMDDMGVKAAMSGWMDELARFNRGKVRCTARGLVQVKVHDAHLEDQSAAVLRGVSRGVRRWAACPRGGGSGGEGARRLMGSSVYIGPGCIEVIGQTNSFQQWQEWQEWQQWQSYLDANAGAAAAAAAGWEAERVKHRALYARWEASLESKRRARAEAEAAAQGAFLTDLMDAMPVAWMSGDVSILSGPSCFRFSAGEAVEHHDRPRRPQIAAVSPAYVAAGQDAEVRVFWDVTPGDSLLCLRDGVRLGVIVNPCEGGAVVALPSALTGDVGAISFLVRAPVGKGPGAAQASSEVAPLLVFPDQATCDEVAALGAPRISSGGPSFSGTSSAGSRIYWAEEPFLSSCALVLGGHDAADLGLSPAEVEEWERFSGSVVELACQHGLELLAEGLLRSLCALGCRPPVTLLHTAVWLGSEHLARILLEEFVVPVNVCAPSCGSITPLHVAALLDNTRMLDLLTRDQFGLACAARAMDAHGLTACDYAQRAGALEHLSLIYRKAGAQRHDGWEGDDEGRDEGGEATPEVSEVSGVGGCTSSLPSSRAGAPGPSGDEVSSGGAALSGRKRRSGDPSAPQAVAPGGSPEGVLEEGSFADMMGLMYGADWRAGVGSEEEGDEGAGEEEEEDVSSSSGCVDDPVDDPASTVDSAHATATGGPLSPEGGTASACDTSGGGSGAVSSGGTSSGGTACAVDSPGLGVGITLRRRMSRERSDSMPRSGRSSLSGVSSYSFGDDAPGCASPVGVLPEEEGEGQEWGGAGKRQKACERF